MPTAELIADELSPIAVACETVGGQAELARRLGVTPAAVNQWCSGVRDVPAERCPEIERETRVEHAKDPAKRVVTCEQLRPAVAWEVLRALPDTPQPEPAPEARAA